MAKKKADNPGVEEYLAALDSPLKPLVLKLRDVVLRSAASLQEDIKWGNCLTFSLAGKNVIQTVMGKDKVTLIFFDGVRLADPQGLLEGDGKQVRSARYSDMKFSARALQALVKQAAKLAAAQASK